MHDEFDEAWTEREETRTAVHGALAGGSTFRVSRKTCRNIEQSLRVYSAEAGSPVARRPAGYE